MPFINNELLTLAFYYIYILAYCLCLLLLLYFSTQTAYLLN